MKKVTNITIGGTVFAIEDSAYEKLSAYLSAIERGFTGNSDYKEIALDIEHAIAEKFTQAGKSEKHAVSIAEVEQVIVEMGSAEALASEEAASESGHSKEPLPESEKEEESTKRFYRDTDDVVIAGVASGIAKYFDIDPVVVRLLFVISLFMNGFGFFAYVILWLIVPPAVSTTEKYAMRGTRVTLDEIKEQVKKNINKLDEKKIGETTRGVWTNVRKFLQSIFLLLGKFFHFLFTILTKLSGIALMLLGAFGIAGLVSAVSIIWIGESAWIRPELQDILSTLYANPASYLFIPAVCIAVAIPLLVFILLGSSLISKKNLFTLTKGTILSVVWIVAVTLAITLGIIYEPVRIETAQFSEEGVYVERSTIRLQASPEEATTTYILETSSY